MTKDDHIPKVVEEFKKRFLEYEAMRDSSDDKMTELYGVIFEKSGSPYDAISAIQQAQYDEEPLPDAVSEWLINGFLSHTLAEMPLEQAFDLKASRGKTSTAKKERIKFRITRLMAELAYIQVQLDVTASKAAEMLEARMADAAYRGELPSNEAYTHEVLLRHWYSQENHWRHTIRETHARWIMKNKPMFVVYLDNYPVHSRPS